MLLRKIRFIFAAVSIALLTFAASAQTNELFDPPALYLTWQRDPAHTMTVQWHTTNRAPALLQFKQSGTKKWRDAKGTSRPMPETKSERTIHFVELTGLKPKTDYIIRFGENSKEFKFRTMPANLSEPIRFAEGGDVYHQRDWMDHMNALAASYDPAFVVIGGDLAYANNRDTKVENVNRWYDFFDSWKKNAVTPDGRLIPLLATLGNHEVKGFWGKTPESAVCFYSLFAMPGKQGYNVLDFDKYLSLVLLDSGHTHPIEGAQTEWLAKTLKKRRNFPHVFPIYHVPAYPSVRSVDEGENADLSRQVEQFWCPVFEENGIKLSFEHHDHAFKRTHPILKNKVDPNGIVYIGDGAWGVKLRDTHTPEKAWYLAKGGAIRHFFLVTLSKEKREVQAIDEHGKVFDHFEQPVKK